MRVRTLSVTRTYFAHSELSFVISYLCTIHLKKKGVPVGIRWRQPVAKSGKTGVIAGCQSDVCKEKSSCYLPVPQQKPGNPTLYII